MSYPVLLVGGPADGRRLILKERMPYFLVPEFPAFGSYSIEGEDEFKKVEIIEHVYKLQRLSSPDGEFKNPSVYVHSSVNNVLYALVNGYREEDDG